MFFRKVSQYFERKNNHLLVFVLLSFYSLITILSFSSSITLLQSYSQQANQQQEEYILIREWSSEGFSPGHFSQPTDVAIDSKDNVFVTDITARSNAVQK